MRLLPLIAIISSAGCAENRVIPPVEPRTLDLITVCSAGASAKAGVDIAATAKRNIEKNGYEGSFGAAFSQEVAGMIMKINIGDTQRVELYKEYQKCVAERAKR